MSKKKELIVSVDINNIAWELEKTCRSQMVNGHRLYITSWGDIARVLANWGYKENKPL